MAPLAPPDWAKLCEALYPHLSPAERAALVKIWEANHAQFTPLKAKLQTTLDPDFLFDPQP
jgi:hypothetical protein